MDYVDVELKKYFCLKKCAYKVFDMSPNKFENQIDTTLFVQKPYFRTNYLESNIEEDIDFKNQFKIKTLPDPISIRETTSKNNYVDH